jgi:hypothetical protein
MGRSNRQMLTFARGRKSDKSVEYLLSSFDSSLSSHHSHSFKLQVGDLYFRGDPVFYQIADEVPIHNLELLTGTERVPTYLSWDPLRCP